MSTDRKTLDRLLLAAAVFLAGAPAAMQAQVVAKETQQQHDRRMAWWRNARFGMFIHWGLYSVAAGEWNGRPISGMGEWIMHDARIRLTDYSKLQAQFNPVKFDARQWAKIAKNAGMKYVVLTTKHIDGFNMFGTKLSDYNVTNTPFKRDVLKEFADAVRREGLRMGTYYSISDFAYPDYCPLGPGGAWGAVVQEKKNPDFKKYLEFMFGELRELLTNYGSIGVMWFDACYDQSPADIHADELVKMMRSIQPNLIINDRIGLFLDFSTPEQYIPATGTPGRDWETCMTINDTWGFKKQDQNWKSSETLLKNMIDIVSKGGNYLLNVGPTGEGEFPSAIVARLEDIGRWMKVNGESIYGTTASPFRRLAWGRCTQKGSRLFLHVFDWPAGELVVPGLNSKVKKAYLLADRAKAPLVVTRRNGDVAISLPGAPPDKVASVIVLELNGLAEVAPYLIGQAADGSVSLPARDALVHGSAARYDSIHDDIGYWTDLRDTVSWEFTVAKPGEFEVEVLLGCPKENAGSEFEVEIAGRRLHAKVDETGGWYSFVWVKLGSVKLDSADRYSLTIRPTNMPNGAVMNLRTVILRSRQ